MGVAFRDVTKVFGDSTVALDGLDFAFETGEFVVLLGPSGSGKTTACRILAGLERPTSGRVEVGGRDVTALPPRARGMSMVFQNYALYSHKTVYENIAYPLRVRSWPRAEIDGAVRESARLLRIDSLLGRRPRQLSGGEAQRVAVARALVWQPDICLMDEPLSNLDALLRLQTRTELKRLHAELGRTFLFVTHDQEEAMTLGTRVAILNQGRVVQFDTPRRIYHQPATRFVAEFIGRPAMNTINGVVGSGVFRAGGLELAAPSRPDGSVVLGMRPEDVVLHRSPASGAIPFRLEVIEPVEPDTLLFAGASGISLVARVREDCSDLAGEQEIFLELPARHYHFFDPRTGVRLG
ncbi:MAG: ABC transporter ATP-binding protein [Alphaproteobacteria bacterium]